MNKNFTSIIVDDERLSRKELLYLLEDFSEIKVLGEASSIAEANKLIEEFNPDIIFLDIELGGETGFDLLKPELNSKIVFVTAFDEHVIRAFEVNALDYLLKPVHPERLKMTIKCILADENTEDNKKDKLDYDDSVFVSIDKNIRFLKIDTIIYVQAQGNFSKIVTTTNKWESVLKPLKEWEKRLPQNYFYRIHQSTIINSNYIEKIEQGLNNSYQIYLQKIKEPVTMSQHYASGLKKWLKF